MNDKQGSEKKRVTLLEVELAELKNQVAKLIKDENIDSRPIDVSNEDAQLYALSDIASKLADVEKAIGRRPEQMFAFAIKPSCVEQQIEIEAEYERTKTVTDYRCNELGSTETEAQNGAYDLAKAAVDEDLAEQIRSIQPRGGCTKDPGKTAYTEVYPRKTKDKCEPPECTVRCWYEGQAKVSGKVLVKIVPPA